MDKYIGKYVNQMCGIYLVENPLGEVYIGQSVNIPRRINEIKTANSVSGELKLSTFRHGRKNHKFYLLCALPGNASNECLDHFEKLYIRQYKKDGYVVLNGTGGGSGNIVRHRKEREYHHWKIGDGG